MSNDFDGSGNTWWKESPNVGGPRVELANQVSAYVMWLEERHAMRRWRERLYSSMYKALRPRVGLKTMHALKQAGFSHSRLNVVRAIVDTMVSKLSRKKASIKANPSDADWTLKRRAKHLGRFLGGQMGAMEMAEQNPMMMRAGLVHGSCGFHIFDQHADIMGELAPRSELFVDPREAKDGRPRQLWRKKRYAREVLMELFPARKAEIRAAPTDTNRWDDVIVDEEDSLDTNLIPVWEGWHKRSGPKAKDGSHIIVIPNAVLGMEEWKSPRWPIAIFRYSKPLPGEGFWGEGLVEIIAEQQVAIDSLIEDIDRSIYFGSQTYVLRKKGSGVPDSKMGRQRRPYYVDYEGNTPPSIIAPNPVSRDVREQLEFRISKAYELAGILEDNARAGDPLGPSSSGVARQEFYDQQSERYSVVIDNYLGTQVEEAEIIIDTAQRMAEKGDMPSVAWHKRHSMHLINWADVDMERDKYRLTLEAVNFLPDTRAGKIETAEQLAKLGILSGPYVASMFGGAPDIDRAMMTTNAPLDLLESIMDKLEDPSMPMAELWPDGTMNLEFGLELCKAWINHVRSEEATTEEAREQRDVAIERFLAWSEACKELLAKGKQAAAAQQAPPGADPMQGMAPDMAGALPPGPAPETMEGAALPGLPPQA